MMRKILLAAILGVILGVGLGLTQSPQNRAMVGEAQLKTALPQVASNNSVQSAAMSSDPTTALMAVLLGVIVAIPFFLLANKRAR